MVRIGEKLSAFFRENNITQEIIAERLGVSQSYVSGLLTDKKKFGKKQAHRFYELWGISPSWLLTGEGEMLKGETKPETKVEEYLRIIASQQETIARLSCVIERLTQKRERDALTA